MIPFEMNAGNFDSYLGGGTTDGTRVVAAGVVLDLAEHATDADTLAVYHLHDGELTDASGNGHHLTAYNSPTMGTDGIEFSRSISQYASDAAAVTLRGLGTVTIEGWFRFESVPAVGSGQGQNLFTQLSNVQLVLLDTGSAVVLRARVNEQRQPSGYHAQIADAVWTPETGAWYHVALTWQQGVALRLWIDGVNVASDTSLSGNDFLTTNADFTLAAGNYMNPGNFLDGAVDEFRVSDVVRYASSFSPKRYLDLGTFTSPIFDSQRCGCAWAPLVWSATVPGDAALAMEIVIGDALDGLGGIVGPWLGTENVDDVGRYFQWRATLSPTTEGRNLASPTVQSVTATASEAGTNLYHGAGQNAAAIDYTTAVAQLGPEVTSHDVAALTDDTTHWFGLRSVNAEGIESLTIDAEVRLELGASGNPVALRPASVESLDASGACGGRVCLSWLALAEAGDVPPEVFRVYSNAGSGEINFANPIGEVTIATTTRRSWQWTTAAQDDGSAVTFAVRAETLAGGVDAAPPEVTVTIDATDPLPVSGLDALPVLKD